MDNDGFIETGFGTNPSVKVEAGSHGLVHLGFYEQNGRDYYSRTLTSEAAKAVAKALLAAAKS